MKRSGELYEFVFRGLLAEEALDRAGRYHPNLDATQIELGQRLSIDLLDENDVVAAKRMATVYTAIAAFENSARKLIQTVLVAQLGEKWWDNGVSEAIRKKAEARKIDETKNKWHGQRGESSINYTDLGQLGNIIGNNWTHFEAYFPSLEWVKSVFDVIERSRNVIMHSGTLDLSDVERVGIHIRDWVKQVGA